MTSVCSSSEPPWYAMNPIRLPRMHTSSTPLLASSSAKGSLITAAVNESAFSAAADTAGTFRWDGTARQYIYNWNTEKSQAGSYWRIGVRLDDGQTYHVSIGLR